MIVELGTDLAKGGWNAVNNIFKGAGELVTGAVSGVGSIIFPTAQRTTIESEITQAAGGGGNTYRPVDAEAPSVWETGFYSKSGWVDSPYADQYAVQTMTQESRDLDAMVSAKPQDLIGGMFADIMGGLEWAAGQSKKIKTVVDELGGVFEPRETVEGKPTAGSPEGRNEIHSNDWTQKGADVLTSITAGAKAVADQVKGLFNLGFSQEKGQAVFGIQHELKPSAGLSASMIIGFVVIILVIIMGRKK